MISSIFKQYGGAVSLDCWTDKSKKLCYFGLTIHYISEECGKLCSNDRVLLIRRLTSEVKDGEYLREKVTEYLNEFGLLGCIENNIVFVSDRGTNICKALSAFKSINCFAHLINNIVQLMLDKNVTVKHVTAIVHYFKMSGKNALLENRTLKSNISTRWNSVLTMFESVIDEWSDIKSILIRSDKHMDDLNAITLDELITLRDFLKPFKDATAEAEATKRPSLDCVVPWYHQLLQHLQPNRRDSVMISEMKKIGLNYWTTTVKKYITTYHNVAVFLNPLMKHMKCFTTREKNETLEKVTELMDIFSPRAQETEQRKQNNVQPQRVSSAMAQFMNDSGSDGDTEEQSELEKYKLARITDFENGLHWWQSNKHSFPRLYTVARFILSIPASSAAPERLFSTAGRLVNYRPNLRSEMVDEILFLKSNFDLFKNDEIKDGVNNDEDETEAINLIEEGIAM